METKITGISSMATRQLLGELALEFERRSNCRVDIQSAGGVEVAKRISAGEVFDVVFLASDAIDKLIDAHFLLAGSRVDLVRSGVAVAVRKGQAHPDISSEDALRDSVRKAARISYSTGPSGVALAKLFERWGIAQEIRERLVQAPAGVPVGDLVARGEVDLGFQQLSELIHIHGIEVVGPLPEAVQIITTFSAGVSTLSPHALAVKAMLDFMSGPDAVAAKLRQGMAPA